MRPNFKNIDITKDAFAHSAGKVAHEGENWITRQTCLHQRRPRRS